MARPIIVVATLVAATLALSGCNVLAPTRDTEGGIIGEVMMPSTEAWIGDCFTFVDGSNLAYATVAPCAEPHTHVVISTGTLTPERIARFQTLQIAVIDACKDSIELYQETREDEVTPEYIVSNKKERDGREVMHYSCLAKNSGA